VIATHRKIDFEGAMNPVFIGAAPLAMSYTVWRAWRLRDVLSIWVLVWVAATYLVYYPIVLITWRTTYFFYILPALPAVAVAIAQFLRQPHLPRVVTWGYLASLLVGLAFYYPFRDIL
jgi:hypothetical protein